MSGTVKIKTEDNSIVVLIRPRSRLVSVAAFCLLIFFVALSHVPIFVAMETWGIFALFVMWFMVWQFFSRQKIYIAGEKISIEKWLAWFRLGEIESVNAPITNVKIDEHRYKGKGGYFVNRSLVFMSGNEIVARSWQLSQEDALLLLAGPFRHFRKE